MKLNIKNGLFILLLLLGSLTTTFANKLSSPELKIGFVKNMGQVLNQYGNANKEVLYSYTSGQMSVFLREKGFSYQLVQTEYKQPSTADYNFGQKEILVFKSHRIEIDFEGANEGIEKVVSEVGSGKIIFQGKVNAAESKELHHYKKITYLNVYNHIDVEFLIGTDELGEERFKYNIVLHPGANSDEVRLRVNGANSCSIDDNGTLYMNTSLGVLNEKIPFSYELETNGEQGKNIEVSYKKLSSNLFGISGIKQFFGKTIVVDPIAWATYFGGTSTDNPGGITTDKNNNVYLLGRTTLSSGIATVGAYQTAYNGGTQVDIFLAKFNSAGVLQWATYYGGTGDDQANDIEIDVFNNIVIAGSTNSTTGISTPNGMQTALIGGYDGFIARFSQTGGLVYGTYYGYSGTDLISGICTDRNGAVYATGNTNSTVTLTPGTHQFSNGGNSDAFVMKMAYPNILGFGTYYGGTAVDYGTEIIIDNAKNVYLTGYTQSPNGIASSGAYKATLGGTYDGFYAKLDSLGRRVFGTYFGGNANEYLYDLEFDAESNVVLCGYTSSNLDATLGTVYQPIYGGGTYDGYVIKFDSAGAPFWATYVGGADADFIFSVVTDANSNIFVFGSTVSQVGMTTSDALQIAYGGGSFDAYFIKLDKFGARKYATYFGGLGQDGASESAKDATGAIYFSGITYSTIGIATSGAHQTTLSGSSDSYLLKYVEAIIDVPITDNTLAPNQGLCIGSTASKIIGSSPLGGNGTYTYEWLYSSTGAPGTFGIANGIRNGIDYDPGSISTNGYFKRVVNSGSYSDTSATHSITFGTALNAGFTVNKGIQCLNSNVFVFSDTTTSAGPITYYWDFGNGTYGSKQVEQVTFAANKENLYKVSLVTSLNGACGDTNYATVYTITNPVLKTINGKDTVLKGTTEVYNVAGTIGSSYNWLFSNGTGRSYTNTLNIKWTQLGDVQLKMVETNSGSCIGDTVIKNIYVKQPTSEEELFGSDLIIYPNPSEGLFYIETTNGMPLQLKLYNTIGQLLIEKVLLDNEPLNLGNEPNGLYLLELQDAFGKAVYKKLQKY